MFGSCHIEDFGIHASTAMTTFYRPDRHRDKLRTQRYAERGRGEGQDGQGGQVFGGVPSWTG